MNAKCSTLGATVAVTAALFIISIALTASAQSWTNRYNGPGNGGDFAHAIAVDGSGNVYVTGNAHGGPPEADYATIAYTNTGFLTMKDYPRRGAQFTKFGRRRQLANRPTFESALSLTSGWRAASMVMQMEFTR